MLRMEQISKAFGPVQALKDVTFAVRPGTVHTLCGENGAGKSTLMKVLAGVHKSDTGKIVVDGEARFFARPVDALDNGISMLYQELDLAEDMMVYENVFLGRELMTGPAISRSKMIKATNDLISQNGFKLDARSVISDLTPGQCQIVELLKALMRNAKIIVMDEPTSSLSEGEAERLFEIVRELRGRGISIIYISHRMEEVMDLADDVSILRDGEVVHSAPASTMTIDLIVKHMVGRELNNYYPTRTPEIGEVCFQAEELSSAEGINDIKFSVRKGEIVGMAGLVGAGRTEAARAIFGLQKRLSGKMELNGERYAPHSPGAAINAGVALLTEDRKRTGLCVELPCSWNVTMPSYKRIGMGAVLNLRKEQELCRAMGEKVRVKWADPHDPASSLSGGNQQKVVIARWLLAHSDFMIFDEPTRGIDVGAKKEVYTLLNELAGQKKGILMISSELPELFGVCDRILVMRRGQIVGNLVTSQTNPEEVMHLAAVEAD